MPSPDASAQGVASQEAEARAWLEGEILRTKGLSRPDIDAYAAAIRASEREKYSAWKALIDANFHGDVEAYSAELVNVIAVVAPHIDVPLNGGVAMTVECVSQVVSIVWARLQARDSLRAS